MKTKKASPSAKFGSRYGKSVREKYAEIEKKRIATKKCPYCNQDKLKRQSVGIWLCKKCGKKFASQSYYLE